MEKNIIAIVQARLTSSRFPNKIMQKIGDKSIIEHLLSRAKRSKKINDIVLAIPNNKKNIDIKKNFKKVNFFLGSENDVLDRYYKAAKKFRASTVVRICGDCPFIDPNIIDKIINIYENNDYDYVSNTITPTFPDGLDVEVFSFDVLKKAWLKAKTKNDREHVTPFILKDKSLKKFNFKYKYDLSKIRFTIDEKLDLRQLNVIYSYFKKKNLGIEEINKLFKKNKKIL